MCMFMCVYWSVESEAFAHMIVALALWGCVCVCECQRANGEGALYTVFWDTALYTVCVPHVCPACVCPACVCPACVCPAIIIALPNVHIRESCVCVCVCLCTCTWQRVMSTAIAVMMGKVCVQMCEKSRA